jgi:hypothetical protein
MTSWQEYAKLAARLDELYRDDEVTVAAARRTRDTVAAQVGQLDQDLVQQRQRLDQLATVLGRRVGEAPPSFTGVTDPTEAIAIARQHSTLADEATTEAELAALRPPLLPNLSALTRNIIVYAGCAILEVLIVYIFVVLAAANKVDKVSLATWMCAGFPAVAWIVAYIILGVWGRPHAAATEEGRIPPPRNAKLGFIICFLATPVAVFGFSVLGSLFGH